MGAILQVNRACIAVLLSLGASAVGAQEDGRALYNSYCASCHGVELEGQPNWMSRNEAGRLPAPPHDETGHTWHHSDRQLLAINLDGLNVISPGYESDMPAFADRLSETQVLEILDFIKGHWPDREREYQRLRSLRDPLRDKAAVE